MATREATATIKGYYYQFDTTISKLLDLGDGEFITVEGIEDIDIYTATEKTAIQCKYLSKPKYINSAVREPITLMLEHFVKSTSPKIDYILYAHFVEEKPETEKTIDLVTLKAILSHREKSVAKAYHIDNGVSDAALNEFLKRFRLVFAKEFAEQQRDILSKLKKRFKCSEFEADSFFYNNALRIVIDKAKTKEIAKRRVGISDFTSLINVRSQLFNSWYIALRSKSEYLRSLSITLKTTGAKLPSKEKTIFIGSTILSAESPELPIVTFIGNLVYKYYRMDHCYSNALPLTFVLDVSYETMRQIKEDLVDAGYLYNDGHEEISFRPGLFDLAPIRNVSKSATRITKSSYTIRLVRWETFEREISNLKIPNVVLHFSDKECPYDRSTKYQVFDIKYCESLKDIQTLLN